MSSFLRSLAFLLSILGSAALAQTGAGTGTYNPYGPPAAGNQGQGGSATAGTGGVGGQGTGSQAVSGAGVPAALGNAVNGPGGVVTVNLTIICDGGVTDQSATLNTQINAAPANSVIEFPRNGCGIGVNGSVVNDTAAGHVIHGNGATLKKLTSGVALTISGAGTVVDHLSINGNFQGGDGFSLSSTATGSGVDYVSSINNGGDNVSMLNVSKVFVRNSTFSGSALASIYLLNATDASITNSNSSSNTGQGLLNANGIRTRIINVTANNNGSVGIGNAYSTDTVVESSTANGNVNEGILLDLKDVRGKVIGSTASGNCTSGGVGNMGGDGANGSEYIGNSYTNPVNCYGNLVFENNIGTSSGVRVIGGTFTGANAAGQKDIWFRTQTTVQPSVLPTIPGGATGSGYQVGDVVWFPSGITVYGYGYSTVTVTSVNGSGAITGIGSLVQGAIGSVVVPVGSAAYNIAGVPGSSHGTGGSLNVTYALTGSSFTTVNSSVVEPLSFSTQNSVFIDGTAASDNNSVNITSFVVAPSIADGSRICSGQSCYFPTIIPQIPPTYTANQTLLATQCGSAILLNGTTTFTLTLPASVSPGCTFKISNNNTQSITISATGTTLYGPAGSGSSTKSVATNTSTTVTNMNSIFWLTTQP